MKIGSQAQRSSAISASNAETIVVRGHDLCGELVGAISFTDHVWLLITGKLPGAAQRRDAGRDAGGDRRARPGAERRRRAA